MLLFFNMFLHWSLCSAAVFFFMLFFKCSQHDLFLAYFVQVAKENADVIIMDDNFATIVNVARWGRSVYINIQKFVQFQLTVNVVALVLNFFSACISGLLV